MKTQVRVGIDIHGAALRYAEVEQHESQYHLLRLGSCDFDFDVAHVLLSAEEPAAPLDTLAEALSDVLEGTMATHMNAVLHPPHACSFFIPLDAAASEGERRRRLLEEAALLTQRRTADIREETGEEGEGMHLTTHALSGAPAAAPVPDEAADPVTWFHVLAMQRRAPERLERALSALPQLSRRWMLSTRAAAQVVGRAARREGASEDDYALAVGWYPSHVEYALCRDEHWHFSHHTAAGPPVDSAYFAAAMLEGLGLPPAAVRRVFVYGEEKPLDAFAPLGQVFGAAPQRLNPMPLVDLDPGSLAGAFNASAYAPCIGAML